MIYTVIFSFISGILSSMGFGGGTVLIVFLTSFLSFPQTKAQGINLLFFIPCAFYSLIAYSKEKLIVKEKIVPLVIGGIIGISAGYFFLQNIPSEYLSKLFGAFLVVLALKQLKSIKRHPEN